MKKKIKDLTLEDMPQCWNILYNINSALVVLFTEDEKRFNYAKSTLPEDIANTEIEVEG